VAQPSLLPPLGSLPAKHGVYISNGLGQRQNKDGFYDMWKLYEIQILVPIKRLYWNPAMLIYHALTMTAFTEENHRILSQS
jgi:hypothetical protein